MMNARLKNVFSLSSKVTVYVPATVDIDKEIDNKKFVDRAATLLSDCFGGATSTDALGYWTSPTAGLVKEKTTMVFAYASEKDLRNKLDQVIDLCEDLKKRNDSGRYSVRGQRRNVFHLRKSNNNKGVSHKRQAPINWRACNVSGI